MIPTANDSFQWGEPIDVKIDAHFFILMAERAIWIN